MPKCVDAGTRAAGDLGYKCVVVHDACATRDQEFEGAVVPAAQVHAAFMAALKFGYAKAVSTEEYLAMAAGKPQLRIVGGQVRASKRWGTHAIDYPAGKNTPFPAGTPRPTEARRAAGR